MIAAIFPIRIASAFDWEDRVGAISEPQSFDTPRGHNIPHYANTDRVAEAGYSIQPFVTPQTIFHMPPEPTQLARIEQMKRDNNIAHAEPSYALNRPIFDGLAQGGQYHRLAQSNNIEGTWVAPQPNIASQAIPGAPNIPVDVNVKPFTPVRLSISAANRFGNGGGEQLELRVSRPGDHATFTARL